MSETELHEIGLPAKSIEAFLVSKRSFETKDVLNSLRSKEVLFISYYDDRYPKLLRELAVPPIGLFVRGNLAAISAVAIVGTRKMTAYGKRVANDVATSLAAQGVAVVSGLALGVDAEVHRATLRAGGVTWAILGSGVDVPYPAMHRGLAEEIITSNGALISEFPLGTRPERYHFPIRNRIIAGLTVATVVVEAAERSGSLLTARAALEANRDVFAVPGSIYSPYAAGPHRLIQLGAKLIHTPGDVLAELGLHQSPIGNDMRRADSAEEAAILQILGMEAVALDDLAEQSGLSPAICMSTLTLMEMKGRVRNLGANMYVCS